MISTTLHSDTDAQVGLGNDLYFREHVRFIIWY